MRDIWPACRAARADWTVLSAAVVGLLLLGRDSCCCPAGSPVVVAKGLGLLLAAGGLEGRSV